MKYSYRKQNNFKVVIYAVVLAVAVGIGLVIVQDIDAPVDHINQEISVNLEK